MALSILLQIIFIGIAVKVLAYSFKTIEKLGRRREQS